MDLAARLRAKGVEVKIGRSAGSDPSLQSLSASSCKATKDLFSASAPASTSSSRRSGASSGPPASAPAVAPVHVPLESSEKLKQKLFTPLAEQGAKAIAAERRIKEDSEEDLLGKVRHTLKQWVQDCLASKDKQEKFLEKGMLKCRVQAKWSEGLHEKLKAMICEEGYGGRLAADGEKENREDKPWEMRNERWVVGFDALAFEKFMRAHPEVVQPSETKFLQFLEENSRSSSHRAELLKNLNGALQKKFGPLSPEYVERARQILVLGKEKSEQRKRPLRLETNVDLAWAASVLAPWGLRQGGIGPVVRSPSCLVLPVLDGLGTIASRPDLQKLLQQSQIGKVVNGLRHHSSAEVIAAAKKLVDSWRRAVAESGKSRPAINEDREVPAREQRVGEPAAKRQRVDIPDKKAKSAVPSTDTDEEAFWKSL